ncbi:MAG TPA: ATP-binding protein, partial [Puia sp.]|nr:ATP-binding protein [Puia sp.]
ENFVQSSDENFLSVIIRNLLQNAIRYGDKTKPVLIEAAGLTISIMNFSEKELAGALNSRLSNTRVDSKTSGLGLQIAADLASKINVRLHFQQGTSNSLRAILSWISPTN